MEDIIQILFIGITILSVIHKSISSTAEKKPASSSPTVSPKPFPAEGSVDCPTEDSDNYPTEDFPNYPTENADTYPAEEIPWQEENVQPAVDQPALKCSHNNNMDQWSVFSATDKQPATETQAPCLSRQEPARPRISLRNPQEARRAFLAAEIFRRKYE